MKDLVFDLIDQEKTRQSEGLELIPSENYVSEAVLNALQYIQKETALPQSPVFIKPFQ